MTLSNSEKSDRLVITTEIQAVTVYNNQALIVRKAEIDLTGTEKELVIEGLPLCLQTESVRTRGSGTVPIRILGLQIEKIFSSDPIKTELADLKNQTEILKNQQKEIENRLVGINLQRGFIQELGKKYLERFSSLQPPNEINLDEISRLLNFIGNQDQNYANEITNCHEEILKITNQINILSKRSSQIQTPSYTNVYSSYQAIINIEAEGSGKLILELSYLVNKATWKPFYDLRTDVNGENLNLTYLAEVQQQTGEDWNNINLTLSTAKPSLGKIPAQLKPIFISPAKINESFGGRGGHDLGWGRGGGQGVDEDIWEELEELVAANSSAKLAAPKSELIEAKQVAAETSQVGGLVNFSLDRPATIPSDNEPHKVTVFNSNYSCQTHHISIPRLDSCAYLQAKAINPADGVTLLPGKANIFRDNTFVGTTQLEHIAPSQFFNINLGIDNSIKVTRILAEREVELIGNYRRVNYAYRIEITNLRSQKTQIQVIEQLPVSRDERIKVRLLRTQPEIELGEMGKLEWNLILQPKSSKQSQREIVYQSSTEYPTELNLEYFS